MLIKVKSGLTKRAPDVWESARFRSIFLASGFSCSQTESTPTHTQVTQTVSPLLFNKVPLPIRREMVDEVSIVAEFCKTNLDLINIVMPDEYGYSSLPLCVIEAVFSIGANYVSTKNTVDRFCEYVQVSKTSLTKHPDTSEQLSISNFLQFNSEHGIEGMAKNIYKNSQRTSTQNGILKAEAVVRFSEILLQFGVDYLQDLEKILGNANFESAVTEIPGQRSGISLRYFYMLTGAENYVKPDRMVMRFIKSAIDRIPSIDESHQIIVSACEILSIQYPALNPRALDHQIWLYQRKKK